MHINIYIYTLCNYTYIILTSPPTFCSPDAEVQAPSSQYRRAVMLPPGRRWPSLHCTSSTCVLSLRGDGKTAVKRR